MPVRNVCTNTSLSIPGWFVLAGSEEAQRNYANRDIMTRKAYPLSTWVLYLHSSYVPHFYLRYQTAFHACRMLKVHRLLQIVSALHCTGCKTFCLLLASHQRSGLVLQCCTSLTPGRCGICSLVHTPDRLDQMPCSTCIVAEVAMLIDQQS